MTRVVRGVQKLVHLAVGDICLGRIILAGKQTDAGGGSRHPFRLESVTRWGHYALTFEATAGRGTPDPLDLVRPAQSNTAGPATAGNDVELLATVLGVSECRRELEIRLEPWGPPGGSSVGDAPPAAASGATHRLTIETLGVDGPDPPPTYRNVAYGDHWQQVLDFYRAPGPDPKPLLVHIHGGGWQSLDKAGTHDMHVRMVDAGIHFASINYRLIRECVEDGLYPPVRGPLADAARAIQFLRHHAHLLGIRAERIGAVGGSAGGCSCLWLALHADLADPASTDPVARESTRLWCAGGEAPQTTLDPLLMRRWVPTVVYGAHAFGIFREPGEGSAAASFDRFLATRSALLGWIREYSPYENATKDAPPIYLTNPLRGLEPEHDEHGWATHAPQFCVGLKRRLDELGTESHIHYRGGPPDAYDGDMGRFFIETLLHRQASRR